MSTIPASQIVNVLPGVLSAGGNQIILNGMCLTASWRVPLGTVQSFPDALTVSSYFGPTSKEYAEAVVYFNSFDDSTQKPGQILFTQYNANAVGAWLRSGNIAALGLAAIQAMSGSLTVIIDGYTYSAPNLNLSAATSYSAAAALIQAGLNASPPTEASVTGSIAITTAGAQGSIDGYVLTVSNVTSGVLQPGAILTGTGISVGTMITSQLTQAGTAPPGGMGTYAVNISQIVPAATVINATYGTLTVTAVTSGTISVGQTLSGANITAGTQVTGLGTGSGLSGTYFVTPAQTVASETITATGTPFTVTFDSTWNGFIIRSGITGPASSVTYASGTLADPLLMTYAKGAILSQGDSGELPGEFMDSITQITQNWASFFIDFDPDYGNGNVQKMEFAAWVNAQNYRYAFICWDPDPNPGNLTQAPQSMGYLLAQNNYSGTCLIFEPGSYNLAAMMAGYGASLDFNRVNGRTTAAFRRQTGMTPSVSNAAVAANLISNGYNFYGAYATAAQTFQFFYPGSISGPFLWLDSFFNQIWLNAQLQQALLELLLNTPSIPYNSSGYALIEAGAMEPILEALNFGAIRAGVPLSQGQIADVNNQAGMPVSTILTAQGYYFLVQPATPQVREARQSPPCTLWYLDGQSVQKITLASIDVL